MLNAFLKLFHYEASELVFNNLIELAFLIKCWYLYHPDLCLVRSEIGISLDLIAHLLEVLYRHQYFSTYQNLLFLELPLAFLYLLLHLLLRSLQPLLDLGRVVLPKILFRLILRKIRLNIQDNQLPGWQLDMKSRLLLVQVFFFR